MKVLIEVSARHIHLNETDFYTLFGADKTLTPTKELSQPGQFVCAEKLTVKGAKSEIQNIAILGPFRKHTQVEISLTDARKLGIDAPIRDSGDLLGTPSILLIGPNGSVLLEQGLIVARRHIHIDPKTASKFNLIHNQTVQVKVPSEKRALVFDDVRVCVSQDFLPAMHIDTDEANAAGITSTTYGEIIT